MIKSVMLIYAVFVHNDLESVDKLRYPFSYFPVILRRYHLSSLNLQVSFQI